MLAREPDVGGGARGRNGGGGLVGGWVGASAEKGEDENPKGTAVAAASLSPSRESLQSSSPVHVPVVYQAGVWRLQYAPVKCPPGVA